MSREQDFGRIIEESSNRCVRLVLKKKEIQVMCLNNYLLLLFPWHRYTLSEYTSSNFLLGLYLSMLVFLGYFFFSGIF